MSKKIIRKWGIYRHCKGDYHIVLGLVRPSMTPLQDDNKLKYRFVADFYDTGIGVFATDTMLNNGEFIYDSYEFLSDRTYVLHKHLCDDEGVYATPLADFLGKASTDKIIPIDLEYHLVENREPINIGFSKYDIEEEIQVGD